MADIKMLPALAAALLLVACQEEQPESQLNAGRKEYREVLVSLELQMSEEASVNAENELIRTKAVDDPVEDVQSTAIRNLCIIQYDGTGDDAIPVGQVHYMSDDADPVEDEEHYLNLDAIRLAESDGKEHTLVILANTFRAIPAQPTLGKMLALTKLISKEADIFGHPEGIGKNYPADGDYYQAMNALAVTTVTGDTHIKALLRRAYSRIKITVSNTGKDGLAIKSVQLKNVPISLSYISDYHYFDQTDGSEKTLREQEYRDSNSKVAACRFDYPKNDWPSGGAGTQEYSFYIPCNMCGENENQIPSEKKNFDEAIGCTCFEIVTTCNGKTRKNLFYLGANDTNDYSINPNTIYEYKFSFDGELHAGSDVRVTPLGRDFNVDANCYMLAPSPVDTCVYTFNVVHRVNTFWSNRRYNIKADFPDGRYDGNTIGTDDVWKAKIIWSDFKMTREEAMDFLDVKHGGAEGTGGGSYSDPSQRITVRVPAGHKGGNVLVGIYKDDPNNILWSWHLWITDYVPDEVLCRKPKSDVFTYNVSGGEVHHYFLTNWQPGKAFENSFIMDRNIGTLDQSFASAKSKGKYYQYGRKDPIGGDVQTWSYSTDFTPTAQVIAGSSNGGCVKVDISNLPDGTSGKYIPWSVNHPNTAIFSHNGWTDPGVFSGTWYDPKPNAFYKTEYEERENKSFFDPCPPGWKVPDSGWVAGLNNDAPSTKTCNFPYNKESEFMNRGNGRTYCPLGYLYQADSLKTKAPTAFFPMVQGRWRGSITTTLGQSVGNYWSTKAGTCLRFYSSSVAPDNMHDTSLSETSAVRCVTTR